MKISIILSSLLITTALARLIPPSQIHKNKNLCTLEVTVNGIKDVTGTIRICLIDDDKSKFLNSCDHTYNIPVQGLSFSHQIDRLPPGLYCMSLYHDVNDDEQLSLDGLFGLPSEPYGFSNNPRSLIGPPRFKRCQFLLEKDCRLQIEL